jgi:GlcNAc-P-P-Und epimerase
VINEICVVGGSVFIGTRLVTRLLNFKIKIIDKVSSIHYAYQVSIGDVYSVINLDNLISESSAIINLAAEHGDDVRPLSLYDEVNVDGARNVSVIATKKES